MGHLEKSLTPLQIRDILFEFFRKEILGPAGGPEEEVVDRRVRDRYLIGCIAPKDSETNPEEIDDLATGGMDDSQDGESDSKPLEKATFLQSSFGLTFMVGLEVTRINITAKWGIYVRQESVNAFDDETGKPRLIWKREPQEEIWQNVDLEKKTAHFYEIFRSDFGKVMLQCISRPLGSSRVVSVYLVNEQHAPKQSKDAAWLFQPELIVESVDGSSIFKRRVSVNRPSATSQPSDADDSIMEMLYRDHVEFAVGHGVSVHAEVDESNSHAAKRVLTTFIPSHEVERQTPPDTEDIPKLANLVRDMKELAFCSRDDFREKLSALPECYADWIAQQRVILGRRESGLNDFQDAAQNALERCEKALQRIRAGIELVSTDETAAEAFRFANHAMWLQRVRSIVAEKARQGITVTFDEADKPSDRTWYPFQLGFILLNLTGITNLDSDERSEPSSATMDLLWFPTGGGKTEAYLGLSAYVLGLRRLQGEIEGRSGNHGIAVLMRYTLRLLTIQQFQRAAVLICACESIRRTDESKWGSEPFRIGLWVGSKATPNRTKDSEKWVSERRQTAGSYSFTKGGGSPAQLTHCPWCGTKIDPGRDIRVESFESGRGRTLFLCNDPSGSCPFTNRNSQGEGIPAMVVDEEIYRRLPSMLIATVDKFAQMPWKGETQNLFGQVSGYCERHGFRSPQIEDSNSHSAKAGLPKAKTIDFGPLRPPDLIIQDELHLISGPLGTLVGLYETAIDELCSWNVKGKTVRPKIIASTATIRKSSDQGRLLFARKVDVFPPQGLDAGDNFFSLRRAPSEKNPGRLYVGLMAPGIRLKAALIKVYAALLAVGQKLFDDYGDKADPWMTLVGYFNSIRELAGMRRVLEDSVPARLRAMDARGLSRRYINNLQELTSRRSSEDIPDILNQMETRFKGVDEDNTTQKSRKNAPIDVLLASNMLSVGVDIKRLGLMIVAGQPKSTSEYIQATSRVGRKAPGVVFTVFNWTRPRDISHYERFEHFHDTFYKHVEALSLTPFSTRALDRGLSAVLVAMMRLLSEEFNHNHKAMSFMRDGEITKHIMDCVLERVKVACPDGEEAEEAKRMVERRFDYWSREIQRAKQNASPLFYHHETPPVGTPLINKAESGSWDLFTCLNSLREVEKPVRLILNPEFLKGSAE